MDLDLTGPWAGWRLRGRFLISPEGDRLSVERLRGIAVTEFIRKTFGPKPGLQGDNLVELDRFRRDALAKLSTR
jgi:hypothetical protein